MILLSDFNHYATSNKSKIIGIRPIKSKINTVQGKEENHQRDAELLFQKAEKTLQDAEQSAEKMIEESRQTILAEQTEWQESRVTLEEEAKDLGYRDGFEAGSKEGHETYHEAIQQAVEVIESAKNDYQTIISDSEDMILHLALAAASKIIKSEVLSNASYVEMVKHVIKEVKDQTHISVYAHPEDYQAILSQKEELTNIVHFNADLAIYPDSELERGSCIIESPYGRIDAGVDSQLQEMRSKLFDLSREDSSES